jgi:hypothetical protein
LKALLRRSLVCAFCACFLGCAAPQEAPVTTVMAVPGQAGSAAAGQAMRSIAIGRSSKADVIAALGRTTVVSFDSGFEVWVYRYRDGTADGASWLERMGFGGSRKGKPGETELVILFVPSGIAAKARIRLAPSPGEAVGESGK